jgi:hypothetical protein
MEMRVSYMVKFTSSFGVIMLLALTQLSAAAAPPTIETQRNVTIDVIHGQLTAICGFPVRLQTEGFFKTLTFVDAAGNPTRQINQAVFHGSLSANGRSITSKVAGPEMVTFNDDNTVTIVVLGVSHRNVPGAGHVGMSAGRVVVLLTFDENGEVIGEEVVSQSGLAEPLEEICDFLAPDA